MSQCAICPNVPQFPLQFVQFSVKNLVQFTTQDVTLIKSKHQQRRAFLSFYRAEAGRAGLFLLFVCKQSFRNTLQLIYTAPNVDNVLLFSDHSSSFMVLLPGFRCSVIQGGVWLGYICGTHHTGHQHSGHLPWL